MASPSNISSVGSLLLSRLIQSLCYRIIGWEVLVLADRDAINGNKSARIKTIIRSQFPAPIGRWEADTETLSLDRYGSKSARIENNNQIKLAIKHPLVVGAPFQLLGYHE